tara:strand:- start:839 stop:1324 length:486 start_codon:yes stop_codon:yes gene_type:complete
MAADRATVSVSASLLPDEIKTSVGGTTVYDLNDLADNNKWIYSLTLITTVEDLIKDGVNFLGQGASEEGATASVKGTDDVVFLFVKHSGTTDGSTATTATLAINLGAGTATGTAVGDIIIKPNECFFARIGATGTEIQDINAVSSSGAIQAQVFAIVDDGG